MVRTGRSKRMKYGKNKRVNILGVAVLLIPLCATMGTKSE